jgi:AraC-like DNA-binding protein
MQYQVSLLRELIYGAVDYGADFQELCARMEVTPEQLSNGEGMISWRPDPAHEFWSIALEMTGDPHLGLHLGQHPTPRASFGMLGMLTLSCKTVGDAIRAVVQYNKTISTVFKYSVSLEGEWAVILFEPVRMWELVNGESARQAVDISLSGFTKQVIATTAGKVKPVKFQIKYSARPIEEYERVLGAPVEFEAGRNTMIIKRTDLDVPLISYDKSLYTVFDALLRQKLSMITGQRTMTQQIRQALVEEFRGQIPSVENIAARLNMTPRTLQRKLADENTSFRDISVQLRKELAEELLKTGTVRKQQVATILGYADTDSLRRALKDTDVI